MLTLTRKVGETIKIGDNIEIIVKEIRRNQVRIGIVAPREVPIYREEVYEAIKDTDDDRDLADKGEEEE
jgi:carbon storage regulator